MWAVDFTRRSEAVRPLKIIKRHLVSRDYQEAITYTFIEPKAQQYFCDEVPVSVKNPISSDMAVMRTSLLPGLISAMGHNTKRHQGRIRLFESGLQFHINSENGDVVDQSEYLAGLIYGPNESESWANNSDAVDFYNLKGDVQSLLTLCGHALRDIRFVASRHKGLHPGQCADIYLSNHKLGTIGTLHPELAKSLTITGRVIVFELSLSLLEKGKVSNFKALSKFPQVRRDLALVVDKIVSADAIIATIEQVAAKQLAKDEAQVLQSCSVFDVYTGDSIETNKKSLAVALHFQHDERSLNDKDVQGIIDNAVSTLEQKHGALLRN